VLEKERQVGGLARTIRHGDFRFDLGGHRLHSSNPRLIAWVETLLGDDLLNVPRRSRIRLADKFVEYPLRLPNALRAFSVWQSGHILASYILAAWRRRKAGQDVSFEDWVTRRFGWALYQIYFQPYTEKVWGIPCRQLSADWAAQRISLPNLSETVKRAIRPGKTPPATIVSRFWYPRWGFGAIPERIAERITQLGGCVVADAHVDQVRPLADGFAITYQPDTAPAVELRARHVISTIPLDALLNALPAEWGGRDLLQDTGLRYRDLICVFLAIMRPQVTPDSWTYFPHRELLIGRTHEPRNWSPDLAPNGMTSLVVEVFTGRTEPAWRAPDEILVQRVMQELECIGFLPHNSVVDSRVVRVQDAYPIYDVGYADNVARIQAFLGRWPQLHLVGRTGSFRYLNGDGVMEDAFALVDWLTGQASHYRDVSKNYSVP
jgi:protoporphyrinogen oxidase